MSKSYQGIIFGLIFSVCLIVPFSNDVFISGFPAMSAHFSGENISLVLSLFFIGSAIAQPLYGPFSDCFGRRPTLLIGVWIFTLASLLTLFAHQSFHLLLVGRLFQALGVCSATVSVMAMVRDVYHQKEDIVRATSIFTAIVGAGPALAPLFGSWLNTLWDWQASFYFLFFMGVFYLIVLHLFLKETHQHKNPHAILPKHFIANYWSCFSNKAFMKYCLLGAIPYGIFFAYFSISSFFLIEKFGFHMIAYGVIIAVNGLILVGMVRTTPWLNKRLGTNVSVLLGAFLLGLGGMLMLLLNYFHAENLYTFMLPMAVTTIGIGVVRPTVSAAALHITDKKIAGSASATFNMVSFVLSAFATGLSAKYIHHLTSFGVLIIVLSLVCFILMAIHRNSEIGEENYV